MQKIWKQYSEANLKWISWMNDERESSNMNVI
jgi:hypothetical protein